ncbi:MAG: hypothetical protein JXA06_06175 [Bacteroidetes bacterium]|nr:hypothetical protein [Bacteroidota bacterium]
MSEKEYDELWHYSEQFTRDKLQRSELVTMAWKEGERLGNRRTMGLMKSVMHFRAKELNCRSAFPAKDVGKRTLDAWNHDRVYTFELQSKITPLDFTITNNFLDALTSEERVILDDQVSGFKPNEISKRNNMTSSILQSICSSIQRKAVAYL